MVQSEMGSDEQVSVRSTVQQMLAHANPGNPDRLTDETELRKHQELSAHIVARSRRARQPRRSAASVGSA